MNEGYMGQFLGMCRWPLRTPSQLYSILWTIGLLYPKLYVTLSWQTVALCDIFIL